MNQYFINNENLDSKLKEIKYDYNDISFSFYTDLGVFSKSKIDYGSNILINTLLNNNSHIYKNFLDIGCGYGFIGIVLSKINNIEGVFSDVNKRALHLTKINLQKNNIKGKVIESDGYINIDSKFDLIISNPPIRAGKKTVLNILKGAINYLNDLGELWFVIRKDQGAKSIVNNLKNVYHIELKQKSKGFYVYCAKKIDNI